MTSLMLQPTTQAQWQALVRDATVASGITIHEDLESYLVFLLMRFAQQPTLAHRALAIDFLQSHHEFGALKQEMLRDVGDKCLLFSGLFPGRAERRRTKVSYYVNLGQSAYGTLANVTAKNLHELFMSLQVEFVTLMDVLLATRTLHGDPVTLSPLEAEDLWNDTGSRQAYLALCQACCHEPTVVHGHDSKDKYH